jgi:hypothetical protein
MMRAGARSMANQVADQVRKTLGQERRDRGNVWDTATNEPPPEESPECQWCPICQAARAARLGGPGLMSSLATTGGALASMAQDAFSAFEQIIKAQDQNRSAERAAPARPPQDRPASSSGPVTPARPATPGSPERPASADRPASPGRPAPAGNPPAGAGPAGPGGTASAPGSAAPGEEADPPETTP